MSLTNERIRHVRTYVIDMDKVKSKEDMQEILKEFVGVVEVGTRRYKKLKKWLKKTK